MSKFSFAIHGHIGYGKNNTVPKRRRGTAGLCGGERGTLVGEAQGSKRWAPQTAVFFSKGLSFSYYS